MGYESKVRGVIYGAQDEMNRFIASQKLQGHAVFRKFDEALKIYETTGAGDKPLTVLDLMAESIRWSDVDTGNWTDLGDLAVEAGLQYEFFRFGDDAGDEESHYSEGNDGYIYGDRRIICDFDQDEEKDA